MQTEMMNNINTLVEEVSIRQAKAMDDAILGVIKKSILPDRIKTEVTLNETTIRQALEKAIPRRPLEDEFPWAICPNCGGSVYLEKVLEHIQDNETTYCEHCGQALDWSE